VVLILRGQEVYREKKDESNRIALRTLMQSINVEHSIHNIPFQSIIKNNYDFFFKKVKGQLIEKPNLFPH
jgi:hypothetical protein